MPAAAMATTIASEQAGVPQTRVVELEIPLPGPGQFGLTRIVIRFKPHARFRRPTRRAAYS